MLRSFACFRSTSCRELGHVLELQGNAVVGDVGGVFVGALVGGAKVGADVGYLQAKLQDSFVIQKL